MKFCSIFKGRFRQAAWTYMAVKLIIAALVFFYLPCSVCDNWKRYLFSTTLRVFILGHFLYMGFRLSAKLLTVSNSARSLFYLIDFFVPKELMISVPFFSSPLVISSVDGTGNYVILINAVLGTIAALMLARAGWGFGLKREFTGHKRGGVKMDKTLHEAEGLNPALEVVWTEEAVKRIEMAPPFVKKIIEKKAKDAGADTITIELLEQLRSQHM